MPGGQRFDHLAAVLPDSAGRGGAASDDVDEAVHPVRQRRRSTGLNEALLTKAAEAKLLRTNRVRADTTVVPANVAYPTDSGLLAKAVRRIAATSRRIQAAGGAVRTRVRERVARGGQARPRGRGETALSCRPLGRDEATAAVLEEPR